MVLLFLANILVSSTFIRIRLVPTHVTLVPAVSDSIPAAANVSVCWQRGRTPSANLIGTVGRCWGRAGSLGGRRAASLSGGCGR